MDLKNKKLLFIAEKPDAMNKVKEVYNKEKSNLPYTMDFATLKGHFATNFQPMDYDAKYEIWKEEHLPIIVDEFQYKVKPERKADFDKINDMINTNNYDYIVCGTDPAREGNMIFYNTYNLFDKQPPILRFWLAALNPSSIKKALQPENIKDWNDKDNINLLHEGIAREYADWLLGMNLSRKVSLRIGSKQNIGRIITPLISIIADRELEIRNFSSSTSYKITALTDIKSDLEFTLYNKDDKNEPDKMFVAISEKEVVDMIDTLSNKGIVNSLTRTIKDDYAPKMYTTTSLLADIEATGILAKYKKLKKEGKVPTPKTASDKKGENVIFPFIQDLYETYGLITYPRTDSEYLTSDLAKELKVTADNTAKILDVEYDKEILSKLPTNKRYTDDTKVEDHTGIIPTEDISQLSNISEIHKDIYMLICKRFMAMLMPPAQVQTSTLILNNNDELFVARDNVFTKLSWQSLYNKEIKESNIPEISKGDNVIFESINKVEVVSKPPSRFTITSLTQAMEKPHKYVSNPSDKKILTESKGMGTAATRMNIIPKLFQNEYAEEKNGKIFANEKAIDLTRILRDAEVDCVSVGLTADWEEKLKQIRNDKYSLEEFKEEIVQFIMENLENAIKIEKLNYGSNIKKVGVCPVCQGPMLSSEKSKVYFCENNHYQKEDDDDSKENNTTKHNVMIPKEFFGAKINEEDLGLLLSGQETNILTFNKYDKETKTLKKETYQARLKAEYDEVEGRMKLTRILPEFDFALFGKCPMCQSDLFKKNGKYGEYVQCSDKSCDFKQGFKVAGKTLTEKQMRSLIDNKKTDVIKGFTSKAGNNFDAMLVIDDNGEVKMEFANKFEKKAD